MKRFMTVTFIIFALIVSSTAVVEAQDGPEEPRLVAITMHADWCGTCQELNPKVDNVKPAFEDQEVLFTKFDFTDDYTIKQTRLKANWIGIGDIFTESQERGATGYMILVDPATNEVVGQITNDQNEEEIQQTIAALL